MKKGYKCNHCPKFSEQKEKIESHESTCFLNPQNKNCYTCKNWHEIIGHGGEILGDSCEAGIDQEERLDVQDGKPCDKWESKNK